MSNHTPGPWEIWDRDKKSPIINGQGDQVCIVSFTETRGMIVKPERSMANARLIAAAPDLLNGCKEALVYCQSDPAIYPLISLLKQAISKAEGKE